MSRALFALALLGVLVGIGCTALDAEDTTLVDFESCPTDESTRPHVPVHVCFVEEPAPSSAASPASSQGAALLLGRARKELRP